jgi:hypothetical protein
MNIQEELLSRKEFSHLRYVLEHGVNGKVNAGAANDTTDTLRSARPASHEHTEHRTSIPIPGLQGESVLQPSHEDLGSRVSTGPIVRTSDKTSTENTNVGDAEVMDVTTEAPGAVLLGRSNAEITKNTGILDDNVGAKNEGLKQTVRKESSVSKARRRNYLEELKRVQHLKRAGKLSPNVEFSDLSTYERAQESAKSHETSYRPNAPGFVISNKKRNVFMTLLLRVQRLKRRGKLGPYVKLSWPTYEREQDSAMSHEAESRNATSSGPQASLPTPSIPRPRTFTSRKSRIQEALDAEVQKALDAQESAMSLEAESRNATSSGPQASLTTPSLSQPRSIALRKSKIQEALEAQARKALNARD